MADFSSLVGEIIMKLEVNADEDEINILTLSDKKFRMYHTQDCCESVYVESIVGDIEDVLYTPVLSAEEVNSYDNPIGEYEESHTWTFYKIDTKNGGITIRWYGSSNGYYSERVDFDRIV